MLSKKVFATAVCVCLSANSAFASCSKTPKSSCGSVTGTSSLPCSDYFVTSSSGAPSFPTSCSNMAYTTSGSSYAGGCPTYTLDGASCSGSSGSQCKTSSSPYNCSATNVDYAWGCNSASCSFSRPPFDTPFLYQDSTLYFGVSCPQYQTVTSFTASSSYGVTFSYATSPSSSSWSESANAPSGGTTIMPSPTAQTIFLKITTPGTDPSQPYGTLSISAITCSS